MISMFAFSTVLCVLIFIKLGGFFVSSAAVADSVKKAAAGAVNDANGSEEAFSKNAAAAEDLKKKNLFTAPKSESEHPVKSVDGILGDSVLIDGKWYKNGDFIKDAKIVSVEPTYVKIQWNGGLKTFTPIDYASAAAQITQDVNTAQKQGPSNAFAVNIQNQPQRTTRSEAAAANSESKSKAEDPFEWMGVPLTDSQREKLNLVWSRLPDNVKERAKEEWNRIPAEVKTRALEQLEQIPIEQIPVDQIDRQFNR